MAVVTDEQAPLVTTARYAVEALNAPVDNVVDDAPVTAVHVGVVAVQSLELCHWIVPVLPARVKLVPVFGEHKLFVPEIVPATETGLTVMM